MKALAVSYKRVYDIYQRRNAYAKCENKGRENRVAKRNTSIRINGRHYDALTGVLLSETSAPRVHHASKSIDGVVRSTARPAPPVPTPEPIVMKPLATKATSRPRKAAAHTKAHRATPSATLVRRAVAKPQPSSLKRHGKVQGSTLATATPAHLAKVTPKLSFYSINEQRLARAAQTAMSPKVSRFAHEMTIVAPQAVEQAFTAINKAIVIPQTAPTPHITYRPDITPANRNQTATSDIFERALQRATSHEQPAPTVIRSSKKGRVTRALRRRMVSYGAGAVAVLAIAGFLGVQNADNIQFKLATHQAGFAATMPSYQPYGFTMDAVRTYDGYVGLKYVADSIQGSRSYAITEKPSGWNSSSLLTNILANDESASYRVVEKAGRTVYVYGNNQAAWVNNGILYQLVSTSTLGNHEIGQIAASM